MLYLGLPILFAVVQFQFKLLADYGYTQIPVPMTLVMSKCSKYLSLHPLNHCNVNCVYLICRL